jgi:hypothetical protein
MGDHEIKIMYHGSREARHHRTSDTVTQQWEGSAAGFGVPNRTEISFPCGPTASLSFMVLVLHVPVQRCLGKARLSYVLCAAERHEVVVKTLH